MGSHQVHQLCSRLLLLGVVWVMRGVEIRLHLKLLEILGDLLVLLRGGSRFMHIVLLSFTLYEKEGARYRIVLSATPLTGLNATSTTSYDYATIYCLTLFIHISCLSQFLKYNRSKMSFSLNEDQRAALQVSPFPR